MKTSTSNKTKLLSALFTFVLAFQLTSFAQYEEAEDKTLSPYFMVLSDNPSTDQLPLKSTTADVNIVGVIADVTITQTYKNEGKNALEAIYTFPASSNAAVYAMEMMVGTRKITAKIEEKNKARADYEEAKAEGKRASLLEQQRPNVFQMNVANIMPKDEIKVILKYTELLVPDKGTYTFVYPTVVGPRYTGETNNPSSNDKFFNTPYQHEGKAPLYSFDIDVHLAAGMPIQNVVCKTHKIKTTYPQSSIAKVALDTGESKGGNRDFILEYQLAGNKIESGLMLYEHADENFFMLMVQPPKKIIKEEIPPREYVFIVDVSGSMRGFPISVTKKLLRNLVVNLRPTDKFNIMVFAGTSGWMAHESVNATLENVDKAIDFIDNQRGSGSTNILSAMQKALEFPRADESISRSFVVVTDGYISVEQKVFDLIRNNCDNANTFVFGIGSSVNRYLIEGMAHVGLGEPLIVHNEQEANKKAIKFREYINNPVLTQVKRSFSKFTAYDVEPVTIPDVLAERPVVIYGKYKGAAKGTITIKGKAGKKNYKKTFDVSAVQPSKKNEAIRYLWARKKIQLLDDYNNLSYDDNRVKEVTELGLKYNLMTAYTSFIAIEEDLKANDGSLKTVNHSLPMPEGVSDYAVGFEMELDEEEFEFSFHSGINIPSTLSSSSKKSATNYIENTLIKELNTCFTKYNPILESITVTVNAQGKVTNIAIDGQTLNEQEEECLIAIIKKWNFSKFNINSEWKFELEF